MEKLTLDSPVKALCGVGPTRAAAFARIGVHTLRDLVFHFPRAYENRARVRRLCDAVDGESASYILTVATVPRTAQIRRGMSITRFRAFDESGRVEIVYFNQNYLKDSFPVGGNFRFYGRVTKARAGLQMTGPAFEPLIPGTPLPPFVSRYPLSEGLSHKVVEKAVKEALRAVLPTLPDYLPDAIREKHGFPTLSYALMAIHNPPNEELLSRALRRAVYDELFCFSLGMGLSRNSRTSEGALPCPPCDLTPLLSQLPYELTGAQKRVIEEIRADMAASDRPPMSRILVGDVGSGKTVCAAAAIYIAIRAGKQAALMVPTEILARQHYEDLAPLFGALGIRVELLLGATTEKEKRRIRAACAGEGVPRADLVIGTHALLSDKVHFSDLGLTVTDEQHRFGVRQRATLKEKEQDSHLLVMSATPIPRTLALSLYGDLDISRIDEMPRGRQRVDTYVVGESYRARLLAFIRKEVEAGGQVYIVCPTVEERTDEEEGADLFPLDRLDLLSLREEEPPLKAATAYAAELSERFPDLTVAFLHGKMKSAEKEEIMHRFAQGAIQILVSTTVIEVGVNVPNACLMIVENAERFGLSQLHQLRGRVGRGTRKSYCILVSDARGETARARLEVMRTTYDGYTIAERDLEQRGPGDFFAAACGGTRQSGGMSLHLSYLCSDSALMEAAAADARALLLADPALSQPAHAPLLGEVKRLFDLQRTHIS